MATIIEQFVARLNWDVDDKGVKQFQKNMGDVARIAKVAAAAIAGATAAAVGFAVVTNKQTAINTNLARSVGLSAESFDAWAGLLEQMGFDGERVVDLVEEMNNKLGEMKGLGEMTAVSEGLKILGLEFKKIRDLKPEEQFLEILSTAKEMEDQQKAVSAVDMIMGGEANKVVGFLRTIDGDLEGIIKRRMQLNLLDEEAREGAVRFNLVWADMLGLFRSLGAQFAGLLGDALTPMINDLTNWAVANREIIKSNIKGFVEQLASALKYMLPKLKDLVVFISNLVERFGGLGGVIKIAGLALTGFVSAKAMSGITGFIDALKTGRREGKTFFGSLVGGIPGLSVGFAVGLGLIAEDLYQFYKGNKSVAGQVSKTLEEFIGASIEYFGRLFNIPKKDLDKFLVDTDDKLKKATKKFGEFIVADVNAFISNIKSLFYILYEDVRSLWKNIKSLGGLIGGGRRASGTDRNRAPLIGAVPTAFGGPSPSPAAVAGGNRTNNVNVNSPITINGVQYQNAQEVADAVQQELRKAAGWAVDTNDTGVAY